MQLEGLEKREHVRVFFTLEEAIPAEVVVPGKNQEKPVPITILSISLGGISFLGNQYKLPILKPGNKLIIRNIKGPLPLGAIDQLEVEIRYVIDRPKRVRASFGCQIVNLPTEYVDKIDALVKQRFSGDIDVK